MNAPHDVSYRLALAKGFLAEAEQDMTLERWRSCVDNSQLAVENTGKTALSLFGVPPKTHDPVRQIAAILRDETLVLSLSKGCRRKFGLRYSRCFLTCWRWASANIF